MAEAGTPDFDSVFSEAGRGHLAPAMHLILLDAFILRGMQKKKPIALVRSAYQPIISYRLRSGWPHLSGVA